MTNPTFRSFQKISPFIFKFKLQIIVAIICLICVSLANFAMPLLFKLLIDGLAPQPSERPVWEWLPWALIVGYVLLRMSAALISEFRESVVIYVTQNVIQDVYKLIYRHLLELSLDFHLSKETGGLVQKIKQGIRGLQALVSCSVYTVIPTVLELLLVTIYFYLHYNAEFVVIILLGFCLYFLYSVKMTERCARERDHINQLDTNLHQKSYEILLNYELIHSYDGTSAEMHAIDQKLEVHKKALIQTQRSSAILNLGQQLIMAISIGLVLWLSVIEFRAGKATIGDVVLINALTLQLFVPLNILGNLYQEVRHALVDLWQALEILTLPTLTVTNISSKAHCSDQPLHKQAAPTAIEFRQVSFSYLPTEFALRDISLSIAGGSMVAIVGESGSGKSTLGRLLMRFNVPGQGRVLIDGTDVQDYSNEYLRQTVGYLSQNIGFFSGTIASNIMYPEAISEQAANAAAQTRKMILAAQQANLSDFIEQLPNGYLTKIGEMGLTISGGERQRLSLARLFYRDFPLLILDEPTSSLDFSSERKIIDHIFTLKGQRTIVFSAHRLAAIVNFDQIVVMDQGTISGIGTHAELLNKHPIYTKLWNAQHSSNV
jgi:ATP-binding cassette subfamily B protein